MDLMVPTVVCEAVVLAEFATPERKYRVGEMIVLPYGLALQLRAFGSVGAFKDEQQKHLEASESLAVYGGDSWFPPHRQSIRHVASYLNAQAEAPASTKH